MTDEEKERAGSRKEAQDEHTYYMTWNLEHHPEGIKGKDIPEGWGASQSAVLISCAEHEDGSYSQMHVARDGLTGEEMDGFKQFKAWLMMGMGMVREGVLDPVRAEIVKMAAGLFHEAMRAQPGDEDVESDGRTGNGEAHNAEST